MKFPIIPYLQIHLSTLKVAPLTATKAEYFCKALYNLEWQFQLSYIENLIELNKEGGLSKIWQ